jgi:hypothetical protein
MLTIKCPECSAGLHITFKDKDFSSWKACKNCGVPSYVIASGETNYRVKSLHQMIADIKEKKMVAEALYFIMNRGSAQLDDIYFNIGRKMENDLVVLEKWQLIKRSGDSIEITKGLEPFIMKEIKPYLPKNSDSDDFF